MKFELIFQPEAEEQLENLKRNPAQLKRYKAVTKSLANLENNPRHPSLNTHKYNAIEGPNGEEVFEAYAENKTPAAFRIFWYYGPDKKQITILAITAHP